MADPKFNIRITGDSSAFASELKKATSSAEAAAKSISGAFGRVQGVLAGLGVGVSVGGFASFIKSNIDALDRLGELSEIAGISATTLGGLGFAAKQSGVDIESLSKGIKNLNVELAKALGGDKAAQELFKKLGIDPNKVKSADEAFLKIADSFTKYADGAGKAQFATAAFGKGGEQLIPALNQGGEELRKNIEYYKKYSGVTDELVRKSDEFNDSLDQLTLLSGRFGKQLVAELLPSLQGLVTIFIEGKEKGDDFNSTARDVAEVIKGIATAAAVAALSLGAMGNFIGGLAAATVARFKEGYAQSMRILDELDADMQRRFAQMERVIDAIQGKVGATPSLPKGKGTGPAPVLSGGGKGKAEVDEFGKAMEQLRQSSIEAGFALQEAFSGEKFTATEKFLAKLESTKAFAELDEGAKRAIETAAHELIVTEKQIIATDKLREAREKYIKEIQEQADAEIKLRIEANQSLAVFTKHNDEFEQQIAILGKGEEAQALLNAQLAYGVELEKQKRAGNVAGIALLDQQYERQKKLIAAYYEANAALQQQIEFNRIFTDSFADAVTSVVTGSKSLSQAFRDMEHSIVQSISRIASQKIAESLFGVGPGGGGGIGSLIGLAAKLFGGGTTSTPGVPTGNFEFPAFAGGTSFAPGGLALVGERGPELVNLPRGSQVMPHGRGLAPVINISVHQAPGASRASSEQLAADTGRAVQRAMRSVR